MGHFKTSSTSAARPHEQASLWAHLLGCHFSGLRSDALHDESFDGNIEQRSYEGIQLCRLTAQAHRASHSGCAGTPTDSGYKLVFQQQGISEFEQDGRRAQVRPGEWAVYDTAKPYRVSAASSVDLGILVIPRSLMPLPIACMDRLLVRPVAGNSGLGGMMNDLVVSGGKIVDAAGPQSARKLTEIAVQLLQSAAIECGDASTRRSLPAMLKARVFEYIDQHLQEPELSIDDIATALNCSKRYLHMIFRDEFWTLSEYILVRRIVRISVDLADPLFRAWSITRVALGWGFSSPEHFSRTFKRVFEVSPREFRANSFQKQA
ncbi:AraC-like ligand-binding domain-containing protein [Burkholderia cepacia]|uniref:AraC-like ligand-binding domain-containing protein n=1 Tax=Burkholderia cepacia TaxID=292 RepID=UPI002AB60C48|nr:AraC family transcriptional regulator [Burkholderia cepacia]